ncbi:MAG: hypothetical protein ACYDHZ_00825 [Dehalococcoidia bacterium]
MSKDEKKIPIDVATTVVNQVLALLSPFCSNIQAAGSWRRQRPYVHDLDFVLIPSDHWQLNAKLKELGRIVAQGPKSVRIKNFHCQLDFYIADATTWGTLFLIKTGSAEHNIMLASQAKRRGWHLAASGEGLFNEKNERIAGDTEESIFNALGFAWIAPQYREISPSPGSPNPW